MSIRFVGRRGVRTSTNNTILSNQTIASVFFRIRIGVNASPTGICYAVGRAGGISFNCRLTSGAPAGYVRCLISWYSTGNVTKTIDLAKGSSYAIAVTLNGSSAKTYVNGISYTMGSFSGPTQSASTWFGINHDNGTAAGNDYEIAKLGVWNGYELSASEVASLSIDTVSPDSIAGGSARYYWPLDGPVGSTVSASDTALIDIVSGVALNTIIENGGTATYTDPLVFEPSVAVAKAWIATSGRVLYVGFKVISSGAQSYAQGESANPSLQIDGIDVGQCTLLHAINGIWPAAYLLPPGVRVSEGQLVNMSAPANWVYTDAGSAQAEAAFAVTNYAGRSCFRDDNFVKTLKLGVNMEGDLTTAGAGGPEFANLQIRLAEWVESKIAAYDENLKPIALAPPNTSVTAKLYQNDGGTGIDSTGHPGMTGLIALGWDDTNPSQPTTMSLKSNNSATTVVTERTEYANPGTLDGGGALRGIVKVYEVTRNPSSTTTETQIGYVLGNSSYNLNFENLFILQEPDFIPGTPTVLDTSDRYRVAARTADQFQGVGSIRSWTPFTAGTYSNMWERDHLRPIDDFAWGYARRRKTYNVRYTLAEPFSLTDTPYIYWTTMEADRYSATLSVACGTAEPYATDTLTITTLPGQGNEIIIGSRLFIDNERIRVTNVVMNGLVATCTVIRGDNGTTPAEHAVGPIEVGWRSPMITPGGNILTSYWYHGYFVKLTSQEPHGLCSGMVLDASGSWPTFTYKDGRTGKISGLINAPVVTGPNTIVCNAPQYFDFSNPIGGYTLPAPVTLDPNQCYSQIKIPNQATLPYAAHCKIANQLDAPACFFSLTAYGTRDQWRFAAEQIRDTLDLGRLIFVEIGNEPWNGFFPLGAPSKLFSTAYYPGGTVWAGYIQQYKMAREVFDEVLGSRKSDVRFYINMLGVSVDQAPLNYAAAQNPPIPIDAVALAPYITATSNFLPAEVAAAMGNLEVDEAMDLWTHSLSLCTSTGPVTHAQAWRAHMDSYTAATGFPMELVSYEGFCPEKVFLSSAPNYLEKEHDFTYHPNLRICLQDVWAAFQQAGYVRANFFAAYLPWGATRNMWALYKGYQQDYGAGDGSDGKVNNLDCLAVPGKPNSKLPTTSQDLTNVSVMGQAFRDWNSRRQYGRLIRRGPTRFHFNGDRRA